MKKLMTICLIMAAATSLVSAVPVTDDLWDISQGAAVTASSAIKPGSDARNMFGTNYDSLEGGAGTTLFDDFQPAETIHWIQWQTTANVALGNFKLYAASDGTGGQWGDYGRSFDHFSLFAKTSGASDFTLIYDTDIAIPYEFIDGENTFLVQHTFVTPIIAQEFKAEFRQHGYVMWASGPRIYELDGFAAVPEPATIAILSLGVLSLIRRKKH